MSHTLLVTGFPGFLAGQLIDELRTPDVAKVYVLALPSMREAAERQAAEIVGAKPDLAPVEVVIGDITAEDLALGPDTAAQLQQEVTRVFHLAAIYDLAVGQPLAEKVNVVGTRYVLDFCEKAAALERLVYISTCYVAGEREGAILESDLEAGQSFRNFYESTKYGAEVEVRRRLERIPTVIVRPSVVVGDSQSGYTIKYDGPYFVMSMLARWERRGIKFLARWMPDFGSGLVPLNVAPVDFIVRATAALSVEPAAIGKTFQLADPEPLPIGEVMRLVRAQFGLPPSRIRLPLWFGKLFAAIPGVRWAMGFPRQIFDYYETTQTFDTTNVREVLGPLGISCPRLADYLPVLAEYVKRHPFGPGKPA